MEDLYPLFVYIYNSQGRYGAPRRVGNGEELEAQFKGPIKTAIEEKREVRITDGGDLLCFHAENGRIVYDGVNHFKPTSPEGKQG